MQEDFLEYNGKMAEPVAAFVKKYDRRRVISFSIREYAEFCGEIHSGLNDLCHMGNAWPHVFGLYVTNGMPKLSRTFRKLCEDNLEEALFLIKREIVGLIKDPSRVENSILNGLFKYKLIAVYHSKSVIPVCARDTMRGYCEALGLPIDPDETIWSMNRRLLALAKIVLPRLDTYALMRCLDSLWRNGSKPDVTIAELDEMIRVENPEVGKGKEALVKVRVNQSAFRKKLLERSDRCAVCGLAFPEILVASHVKPWAESTPKERLDPENGLLLCPNHDRLFDSHLISFNKDGDLIVSRSIGGGLREKLALRGKIVLTDKNRKYFAHHRKKFLQGEKTCS